MPVIQIVCPKCHGDIELEDSREFGYCSYCGTKIMISEMIPQKIQFDESHKIGTWLSFCESELKSGNYGDLEKHAEKILENEGENYLGWYYIGAAQIGLGKFDTGFESWVKCIKKCQDLSFLKDMYWSTPSFLNNCVFRINAMDNTDFGYVPLGPISCLERAFDEREDLELEEKEDHYSLVADTINILEEKFEDKLTDKMYYALYQVMGHIIFDVVTFYLDPEVVIEFFKDGKDIGEKIIRKTPRPREEYDIPGSIRWDSIDSDREFYSIIIKKMNDYLDGKSEDEINNVIEYWADQEDLTYVEIYDKAQEASFDLHDDSSSIRRNARALTKGYAEQFVDIYLGSVLNKKSKGLFGLFKK